MINEKWYKKKWVITVGVAIGFIATPILLSQIIRIPTLHWTIGDDKSWIGFLGGYIGAFLGSLITIIIFDSTIKYNREKDEKERLRFETQAQEERIRFETQMKEEHKRYEETKAISIQPYLHCFVSPTPAIKKEIIRFWANGVEVNDSVISGSFCLKNVGLGSAVNINITSMTPFGGTNDKLDIVLQVNDEEVIEVRANFPMQRLDDFNHQYYYLNIEFKDLLGNRYRQLLAFENVKVSRLQFNVNCEPRRISPPEKI